LTLKSLATAVVLLRAPARGAELSFYTNFGSQVLDLAS
jgi:hypothetical protein